MREVGRHRVTVRAGDGTADAPASEVALVGSHPRGRGGGVAVGVGRGRGCIRVAAGGIAVAGGARPAIAEDLHHAVHVEAARNQDCAAGAHGAGVACGAGGRASRNRRMRGGGGQAVARSAGRLRAIHAVPDRRGVGAAARRKTVAVVRAREARGVEGRHGTPRRGQRSPGEVERLERVIRRRGNPVAFVAGDGAPDAAAGEVALVGADARGGSGRVATGVDGWRGGDRGGESGRVAVAGDARAGRCSAPPVDAG